MVTEKKYLIKLRFLIKMLVITEGLHLNILIGSRLNLHCLSSANQKRMKSNQM